MDDDGFWFPTPPHLEGRSHHRGRYNKRRYEEKQPLLPCRYPGCPNLKQRKQGAAYCEEHSLAAFGKRQRKTLALEADCLRCSKTFVLHRTKVRSPQQAAWEDFCPECRNITPLGYAQVVAHRVPPDLIHLWVGGGADLGCGLCGRVFHSTLKAPVLDHDHGCCAGDRSCGKCIRGVVCTGCNVRLGMFEWIVKNNLLSEFVAWLGPIASPNEIAGQWAREGEQDEVVVEGRVFAKGAI